MHVRSKIEREITRLTSPDEKELLQVATVAFMKDCVKVLRETYKFLERDPSSDNKRSWSKHLAKFHRTIIQDNPDFVTRIKNRINQVFNAPNNHQREKEIKLSRPFYVFIPKSRNAFISKKHDVDLDQSYEHRGNSFGITPQRKRQKNYREPTPPIRKGLGRLSMG